MYGSFKGLHCVPVVLQLYISSTVLICLNIYFNLFSKCGVSTMSQADAV